MRVRLLVLAALVAFLPATAPALSVQYNLNDGQGFKDFSACPGGVCDISPGTYIGAQIRITQNQGESLSGYVLNMEGTPNGFFALPFSDPFDDGSGNPPVPVDVTCRVRATADSNCGVNFLGPIAPGQRPNNNVVFGVAEIFAANNASANLLIFSKLDLSALVAGATMKLASSSSLTLGDLSEVSIGGLGLRVIPEPGTVLLLGAGLAGLALQGRKQS